MAHPPPLQPEYYTPPPAGPPAGRAVAGMVCGIVSLPLLCFWPLSLPLAIVAVVLSGNAQRAVRRGTGGGAGMARAGLFCGTITLVLLATALVIFVALAVISVLDRR